MCVLTVCVRLFMVLVCTFLRKVNGWPFQVWSGMTDLFERVLCTSWAWWCSWRATHGHISHMDGRLTVVCTVGALARGILMEGEFKTTGTMETLGPAELEGGPVG